MLEATRTGAVVEVGRMAKTKNATENSNLYGALSYLLGLITGVVMLVVAPKDKFVKFHAMQSILLSLVVFVLQLVLGVIMAMVTLATMGMGALILAPLMMLVYLVIIVLVLFLMYKAYNGEKYMLPVIGKYAADLADKN